MMLALFSFLAIVSGPIFGIGVLGEVIVRYFSGVLWRKPFRVAIPQWDGLHDRLVIYKARES